MQYVAQTLLDITLHVLWQVFTYQCLKSTLSKYILSQYLFQSFLLVGGI